MNAEETGKVLGLAAFYDSRKVDTPMVLAWHELIGDLAFTDAEAAVKLHYSGDAAERLMPGHVRGGVRRIRADRIARSIVPAPDPALCDRPREYRKALIAGTKLAGDGLAAAAPLPPAVITHRRRAAIEGPQPVASTIDDLRRQLGPGRAPRPALGDEQQVARDQVRFLRETREAADSPAYEASGDLTEPGYWDHRDDRGEPFPPGEATPEPEAL